MEGTLRPTKMTILAYGLEGAGILILLGGLWFLWAPAAIFVAGALLILLAQILTRKERT